MKIESEIYDIEDLLLADEDDKTELLIPINGKKYRMLISKVNYGEIKKIERFSDEEKANKILQNHLFNGKGESIGGDLINKFPVGLIKLISDEILEISGMNISKEDIEDF